MSNELLFVAMTGFGLGGTLLAFALGGKDWIKAIIGVNIILANIFVTKQMNLFGIAATGGNILYGSIFLATDLLCEHYDKKEARDGVMMGFFFALFFLVVSQLILVFIPNKWDTVQESMKHIFGFVPRIIFASLVAYLVSQLHDVWMYHKIKIFKPAKKWLWLRNNGSTWLSQLIDSVVFSLLAFWGTMPFSVVLQIIFTTYVLKIIVAACDTPFIYLSYVIKGRRKPLLFTATSPEK